METVKSRAPILRMEKILNSDIEKYILDHDPRASQLKLSSAEEFDELICAADGSIGYAISLLDAKKRKGVLENRRTAREFIDLAGGKHNSEKFEIISSLGTKRQDICDRLFYIQYALRDLILLKKSEDAPLCFYSDREKACELSTHFSSKNKHKNNKKQERSFWASPHASLLFYFKLFKISVNPSNEFNS